MHTSTPSGPRAIAALRLLVDALKRTHWAPEQSVCEFQYELDEAESVLADLAEPRATCHQAEEVAP